MKNLIKQATSATMIRLSAVDGVALLIEMMLTMDENLITAWSHRYLRIYSLTHAANSCLSKSTPPPFLFFLVLCVLTLIIIGNTASKKGRMLGVSVTWPFCNTLTTRNKTHFYRVRKITYKRACKTTRGRSRVHRWVCEREKENAGTKE